MHKDPGNESERRRFEVTDAPANRIVYFAIGLGVAVAIVFTVLWFYYETQMGVAPNTRDTETSAWSYAARDLLLVREARSRLQDENRQYLSQYGWIDREAGIAQIPVERAMAIVAENGLPRWRESEEPVQPIDMIYENAEQP